MTPAEATPTTTPGTYAASGGLAATTAVTAHRRSWARDAKRRRMLAGADALTVTTTVLALGLTAGRGVALAGFVALAMVGGGLVAKVLGLYDRDHRVLRHQTADELSDLLAWAVLCVALLVLALDLGGAPPLGTSDLASCLVLLVALSTGLRAGARSLWRQSTPPERAVIIGSGPLEGALRRKFELFDDMHLELVEAIDDLAPGTGGPDDLLARIFGAGDLDRVLIATSVVDERLLARLLPECRAREVKLGLVPPARGMFGTAVQLDHLAELPIVQYNTWNTSRTTLIAKRALDVVAAAAALTLTLPLLPLIAVAIRLDSPGPVLFRQRRAGKDGVPFSMLKFRTMVRDAEQRLADVVELDALVDPMFKLERDPRVTRTGRLLRRTSVDELPQLWNVLRGAMSLVGPRPEQLDIVARYGSEARTIRLAAKPGLTGPMQVFGRGSLTFEERLAVEREYVENLSLRRDLKLLALTIPAVRRGSGAY